MLETNYLKPLRRLQRLLSVDKREISQVYIYALLNGLVNLSLPLGIQAIVNLIQGGEMSTAWIILVVFVLIGLALTGIFQLLQLRIVENISQRIFSRASFEFAYRIPRIKTRQLFDYYAPELANRFFDTLTIQKGLPKILIDFSLAAFQIIVGLILLSFYHPFFIIFGILLIALVYIILAFTGPQGLKTSLEESKHKYNVAHWLEEVARTKLSFKLVYNPDIALQSTDKSVTQYLEARESHFRVLIIQFLNLIGFKVLIAAGLLVIGSILVFQQQMNIGQFVAAEILIILIINSVEKLIRSLDSVYDVLTALEKIGYVTDMELEDENGMVINDGLESFEISVTGLNYAYPDNQSLILNQLNFTIPKGESVVLMGTAGSGKSTLLGLLTGIYEPTEGVIHYNGYSLPSIHFNRLRDRIGFALSNNQIFLGNVLDNITMGRKDIPLKSVERAIEMVKLDSFLDHLPRGLDTPLNPEGSRIPRSAINKIILARAIVNDPLLLILEDPLDHVPKDEKEEIIKNLTSQENPWQILVTAVDPLWLEYIRNKLVLNNGELIFNSFETPA